MTISSEIANPQKETPTVISSTPDFSDSDEGNAHTKRPARQITTPSSTKSSPTKLENSPAPKPCVEQTTGTNMYTAPFHPVQQQTGITGMPCIPPGMISPNGENMIPGLTGIPLCPPFMMYPPPGSPAHFLGSSFLPYPYPFMPPMNIPSMPQATPQLPSSPPGSPIQTFPHNDSNDVGLPIRSCRLRHPNGNQPGRRRRLIDSDDEDSCSSDTKSSSSNTSDSDAAPFSESESSDGDFGSSRRKVSRRKPIGGARGPGRPRLGGGSKRFGANKPKYKEDFDDSDDSFTFNKKRLTRRKGKGSGNISDGLNEEGEKLTVNHSDSSYSSGARNRKRRRASPSPEARRLSSRHPVKSQRVNYAQLGQSFESDEEVEDLLEVEKSTQSEGPGVDRVLGYRRLDSPDEEASLVPVSIPLSSSPPTIHDYIFLVKWLKTSHFHNSWESYRDVVDRKVSGLRKIENFYRRMETLRLERLKMTEDEIEQQDIAFELQKQLDQDCLIAERILAHNREIPIPPPGSNKSSPIHNDNPENSPKNSPKNSPNNHLDNFHSEENGCPIPILNGLISSQSLSSPDTPKTSSPVDVYLVKWTNSPYDQCTWETRIVLLDRGFGQLIKEYENREKHICGSKSSTHPMHTHDLSRTSFEPYIKTPFYLQTGIGNECRVLRDYQLTGLNWMISRMKKGLSVLLADEMGLGKTVQTISVIGHLMYSELLVGPFLVVVPQSTADNWLLEFKRWLPSANVIVYHGNPQARELIRTQEMSKIRAQPFTSYPDDGSATASSERQLSGRRLPPNNRRTRLRCDVCIATPSILNNQDDLDFLRGMGWYLMTIDEAHLLKNRESKRFKELALFRTRYRLLLSGTPLHNNLEEMWSLLHFLCPNVYNDVDDFKRKFSEIEKTDSVGELKERQLAQLQKDLHELVLRRVKKDVEKSLPKKTERILRVEVSPIQAQCCEAIIARNYEVLAKQSGGNKASLQNICMELKKVCNHPLLLQNDHDIAGLQSDTSVQGRQEWHQTLLHSSGKLALLDKLLPHLKDKGHRVLIFSQMVRMLNILSSYLTLRGFRHQRLDGTMGREVRKKAMDHFNAPESDDFCFLLSTKAGGLGINLTTADTVIIYDSDWNPQNDLQAEARAHRIGQTKPVQIYRLVTKDTVEEKILERAKAKMVLDTLVIQGLNKRHSAAGTNTPTDGACSPNGSSSVLNCDAQANKSGFSFSREELTKILKFGAAKLWKAREAGITNEGVSVDLDKILAEAEERDSTADGQGGLADELLSSFTNISDFRYEAPPDPPEINEKDFWENTIPLEQRLKYESLDPALAMIGTKRQRKQIMSTSIPHLIMEDDEEYYDELAYPVAVIGTKEKKGVKKTGRGRGLIEKSEATLKGSAKSKSRSKTATRGSRNSTAKVSNPAITKNGRKRKAKKCSDEDEALKSDGDQDVDLTRVKKRVKQNIDDFLPEDILSDRSSVGENLSDESAYEERSKPGPPPRKKKRTEAKPKKTSRKLMVSENLSETIATPKGKKKPTSKKTAGRKLTKTITPQQSVATDEEGKDDITKIKIEEQKSEIPKSLNASNNGRNEQRIPRRSAGYVSRSLSVEPDSDGVGDKFAETTEERDGCEKIPKLQGTDDDSDKIPKTLENNVEPAFEGACRIPKRAAMRPSDPKDVQGDGLRSAVRDEMHHDCGTAPDEILPLMNERSNNIEAKLDERNEETDTSSPMTDVELDDQIVQDTIEINGVTSCSEENNIQHEHKITASPSLRHKRSRSTSIDDEIRCDREDKIKRFLQRYGDPYFRPRTFREFVGDIDNKLYINKIVRDDKSGELRRRVALLGNLGHYLGVITHADIRGFYDSGEESFETENKFLGMTFKDLSQLFRNDSFEGLQINALAVLWLGSIKYGISEQLCSQHISNDPVLGRFWSSDGSNVDIKDDQIMMILAHAVNRVKDSTSLMKRQRNRNRPGWTPEEIEAGECSDEAEFESESMSFYHDNERQFNGHRGFNHRHYPNAFGCGPCISEELTINSVYQQSGNVRNDRNGRYVDSNNLIERSSTEYHHVLRDDRWRTGHPPQRYSDSGLPPIDYIRPPPFRLRNFLTSHDQRCTNVSQYSNLQNTQSKVFYHAHQQHNHFSADHSQVSEFFPRRGGDSWDPLLRSSRPSAILPIIASDLEQSHSSEIMKTRSSKSPPWSTGRTAPWKRPTDCQRS